MKLDDFEYPMYPPDTRQEKVCIVTRKIHETISKKIQQDTTSVEFINLTTGFYASYINLGWIKEKLMILEPFTEEAIQVFMMKAIQRVRNTLVAPDDDRVDIKVCTKDDYGVYIYMFSVERKLCENKLLS
jgi:hypothetical protein